MSNIGRNITMLLYDKKVTQRELAKAAACSENMIARIVSGEKTPPLRILVKIAERLDVTVDEILK